MNRKRSFIERSSVVPALFAAGLLGELASCQDEPVATHHVTAASASALPASSPPAPPPVPDASVAHAIERELSRDPWLRSQHVDVAVSEGITTLTGTLHDLLAKRRALAVVETIRGVRSVVDETVVQPSTRPDAELERDVRAACAREKATAPYSIHVAANGGRITLKGTVGSWQEKMILTDSAESVSGVRAVENDTLVHYAASRPDSEIAADVKTRITNDVWLDGDALTVAVKGGVVSMGGVVASVGERSRAEMDALVVGVNKVDTSGISVDWLARDDQRRVNDYPVRSDADATKAVEDAFRYDPRLKTLMPEVRVHEGTAVLRGYVDSARARTAAYEDAKNTVGVSNVENDVYVEAAGKPSELDLERAVKQAVSENTTLSNPRSIQVALEDGTITLRGTVASAGDRLLAVSAAESVPGVSHVQDEITVTLPPEEIKLEIDNTLYFDPMVERNAVTVAVDADGIATLSGTVASLHEIEQASEDALKAGAARVINLLKLKNHPEFVFRGPVRIPHLWEKSH